ncbi:gliding motility protein GldN [Zhouia sp. PK063]|uniref:type IX secretion system ring protein PorN/GldN n=1 Tax=Zhouia sp. PK063 TaxID=3373602 RepID=UPI0037AB792D
MNWKSVLFTIFCGVIATKSFAQANLLNAKTPEEIGKPTEAQVVLNNDKPLPYGYVDDRDILWSKTVWEKIDLNERVNFPLYFPVDTVGIGSDRRSLFNVLMKGIKENKIKIYADSYFTEKRQLSDIEATLSKIDTTDLGVEQLNAGEQVSKEYINVRNISAADIEQYWIKGVWYFDKRQGELKYRLLGIAPVAPDVNFIDTEQSDLVPLFWVWYPSAREVLHKAKAFNDENSARPISFDHLLNSRRFNGIIFKEDNVYGDRKIDDYIHQNALFQLLESERIKEKIRDKEMDMWSY